MPTEKPSVQDRSSVFKYWDDIGTIKTLFNEWNPKGCKTEKQFERSFYDHLTRNLANVIITPQYAHGRFKADMLVGNKILIEIKTNLVTASEYQRLVGQLK